MDPEARLEIEDYLVQVARAATVIGGSSWKDREFALARAREIGHTVAGSCRDWEQIQEKLAGTYHSVLFRASSAQPPISHKEWIQEIRRSFMRRINPFPEHKQIPANTEMLKEMGD